MLEERELITALLGLSALVFLLVNRRKCRRGVGMRWLVWALGLAVAGWWLSVAEGYVWRDALNLLEHACYALGSVALAVWALDAHRTHDFAVRTGGEKPR